MNNSDINNQNPADSSKTPNHEDNILNPPGAYFVPYTAPLKREYKPLSSKESIFILLFFIGSFIFVDFALLKGFNLGFTIAYAVLFVLSTVFIWDKNAKNIAFSIFCGAISLCASVSHALYNNSFIKPISVILIFALFTIYCLGISGSFGRKQGSYKMLIDLVFSSVIHPFENLGNLFGSIKAGAKESKKSLSALIGALISLPVLLVIIPILVSSDAAFEGLVTAVLDNIGIYLLELVVAVIILPYIYSFLFGKKNKLNIKKNNKKTEIKKIPVSGCVSFLSVISATYVIYLFSQLAYFFSAFKGILPEGYKNTASAFARRGFYEMFAICAINIVIISLVTALSKRKNKKVSGWIKGLSCFISLFSVLLIVIAMQKMRLNITIYGLSVNRILVSVFMVMMLVVIAFFIVHIFAPKVKYMQPIIVICSIIFVALSFADVDARVADYNISAFNSGKIENLDVEAIANLSDSAVPYLVDLTKNEDEKISKKAIYELERRIFMYSDLILDEDENKLVTYSDDGDDFRSYNKAEQTANERCIKYYSSLSNKEQKEFAENI